MAHCPQRVLIFYIRVIVPPIPPDLIYAKVAINDNKADSLLCYNSHNIITRKKVLVLAARKRVQTPEARAANAARVNAWRKRNPAKYAATMARYWTKKAKELAAAEGGETNDRENRSTTADS